MSNSRSVPLRPRSARLRRMEQGSASLVFALGMIVILIAFAGYLYDVRRISLAQIHAQDTLDLAAHKAGSDIDIPRFEVLQDVVLADSAQGVALDAIHSAPSPEYNLSVQSAQMMDGGTFMAIRGEISVPLGFISRSFGISTAKRSFLTIVQPAYGIQHQND